MPTTKKRTFVQRLSRSYRVRRNRKAWRNFCFVAAGIILAGVFWWKGLIPLYSNYNANAKTNPVTSFASN